MKKEDKEWSEGAKEKGQGGEYELQKHPWQPPQLQYFRVSKGQMKNRCIFGNKFILAFDQADTEVS